MKTLKLKRIMVYFIAMFILALGLTLNTKAALGTSAIISAGYAVSVCSGLAFGDAVFIEYIILVVLQLVMEIIMKKPKKELLIAILEIPFSVLFTRFMNLFTVYIPSFESSNFIIKLSMLMIAMMLTAIGAATMLNMNIIANPGDGIVKSLSQLLHKSVGTSKNIIDVCCVLFTIIFDMLNHLNFAGIGIGTILSMIGVGRFIALFNHYCKDSIMKWTGMKNE